MFTKRKFLSFPPQQQHKKCAEWLREIYERKLESETKAHYFELLSWMNEPFPTLLTKKDVADAYHQHLKKANQSLKEHHLLPQVHTKDRESGENYYPIAIYLDHIRSAHNVGSIVRTLEAFRLGDLYLSEDTPNLDHKQVKDAAMGAGPWVNWRQVSLDKLPRPMIVMETSPDAIPVYDFLFPETFTLVLGNEEYGCSDAILEKADHIITIPLRGRKNSLNVANAFAIAAAEIARQRNQNETN